jgi:hypothetical protein
VNWVIRVVLFPAPPEPTHSDGEHAASCSGRGAEQAAGVVTGFLASRSSTPSLCGSTSSTDRSPAPGSDIHDGGGTPADGSRECASREYGRPRFQPPRHAHPPTGALSPLSFRSVNSNCTYGVYMFISGCQMWNNARGLRCEPRRMCSP